MRRIFAALCAGAMLLSGVAFAAKTDTPQVTMTAARTAGGSEVVLTVAVNNASFNVLQFAVDYDESKLTPKSVLDENPAADADSMTNYIAPIYERGQGWMNYDFGTFDTATGVVEYTLYADPASKGRPNGSDSEGFVAAGDQGLELISLHFTMKDTADFTADSIVLTQTDSNSDYIILSTKNESDPTQPDIRKGRALVQRDFTNFGISLADTAESEPPEEPDKPEDSTDDTDTGGGSSGGGTGGGNTGGEGVTAPPEEPSIVLTDISGHWAEKDILALVEKGVITGYSDSTFRPNHKINRGECCIFLCRALGLEPVADTGAFHDLAGVWAAPYINAAHRSGLVNGVGDGLFAANRNITRQEVFKMIAGAFQLPEASGQTAQFQDGDQLAPWAADAANRVVAAGIVQGSGGRLNPTAEISRAEMAAMLCRALEAAA